MDVIERARSEFLSSFRWTEGHADLAAVFRNPAFLEAVGPALAAPFQGAAVSGVIGLEARGFVLAGLAARALGVGLVLARKPGSVHPGAHVERATAPDWRGRRIELRISPSAMRPGDRLLMIDDWIETGSQAATVRRLVERFGAQIVGVSVVVDDAPDTVRRSLAVTGVIRSRDLPAAT